MARRRKTADERRQSEYEADVRQWQIFKLKLEAAGSFAAARALVANAPRHGEPGRQFYSNLGFFLHEFTIPNDSSDAERGLYLEFVRRLDAAGELKPVRWQRSRTDFAMLHPVESRSTETAVCGTA